MNAASLRTSKMKLPCSFKTTYFFFLLPISLEISKNCSADGFSRRPAGYWEKFSISNNRASDEPHWLRYCLCAKITFTHVPLLCISLCYTTLVGFLSKRHFYTHVSRIYTIITLCNSIKTHMLACRMSNIC